jgi:MFS family permease
VTWNATLFQTSSVIGPAIGGILIAVESWIAYAVCAVTSLIFMIILSRIEVGARTQSVEPASVRSLLAGLGYMRRNPALLSIVTLDMFAVMLGGAVFLLPIYAKDILHVGATGLGWLTSAAAVGALCMSVTVAHLPPMKNSGRNLLYAVAGFGVATIIFGISKWFWLSWLALFLTGALDNISVVVRHTMVQMLTPDAMRGRVSAINTVFISSSNELGGFESGLVAHLFGPVISVVSGGIGTILVVILMAVKAPSIRRLGSLRDAGAEEA